MRTLKALLLVLTLCLAPASAAAQDHAPAAAPAAAAGQEHAPAGDPGAGAESDHGAEAEHAETSWIETIAKIVNFAVLIGILVHFLRRPTANYLVDRSQQIRHALVEAAATREQASADLGSIQSRLAALPAELEALKARGEEEVQAEQARIKATAAAERERLLAQTRREIDQQYRLARRELLQETAEQASRVARTRLEREMTPADQTRLIDRYVNQVSA